MCCLDNLSSIPDWLSDALCRAVTGDGSVDRTLYTNIDVTVVAFRRVIALTTVGAGELRSDLAERMMTVELEYIDDSRRLEDAEVQAAFAATHPAILGGLLDVACKVLAALPTVRPARLPRMADFTRIAAAADAATGGTAEKVYRAGLKETLRAVLDHDVMAQAVLQFIDYARSAETTATELLRKLTILVTDGDQKKPPRGWPTTPRGLTEALKRLAVPLRAEGIEITTGLRDTTANRTRVVRIEKVE